MLSIVTDPLLTLLYPQFCGGCGCSVERAAYGAACRACWDSTTSFGDADALCSKCGALMIGVSAGKTSACQGCAGHHYDHARAAGPYRKALAASVLHLKHTPKVHRMVRERLIAALDRLDLPEQFTVIPVPLSKQRQLERGFNQAALLARVAAAHTSARIDEHSLVRTRDTPAHRAAMDRKAREASVRNTFAVVRPNLVNGQTVLLVDDVMTSGSTVSSCAKALKKHGAAKVIVLTLARAV